MLIHLICTQWLILCVVLPNRHAVLATHESCHGAHANRVCQPLTAKSGLTDGQIWQRLTESCCRYLHRGKLRCRRWMIGTLIPQTRELLQHVRKLSQLAGADDTLAHARARRARRALKVHLTS